MSTHRRRTTGLRLAIIGTTAAVGATITLMPGFEATSSAARVAASLPTVSGPEGSLTNDEITTATLDPSGLPQSMRLISRLTSVGGKVRTVTDPASQTNVSYLSQRGRPETNSEGVLLEVGGQGLRTVVTEARFDKPLPLALHAQYAAGADIVPPDQVVGSDREITVDYTLTNTTVKEERLSYLTADGRTIEVTKPVLAPFAGTLTVSLPPDAQVVEANKAIRSTDAAGNTILTWNAVLYPPLGSNQYAAKLRYRQANAGIPRAEAHLLPVPSPADPATAFSAKLLKGSVEGNTKLYSSLQKLDSETGSLASGADQVADRAGDLSRGAGTAASSAQQLANGTQALASGASSVAEGSQGLASALDSLNSGATQLADGLTALQSSLASQSSAKALASLTAASAKLAGSSDTLADKFGSRADAPLPVPLPPPDPNTTCQLDTNGDGKPDKSYDDDCVTLYQVARTLGESVTGLQKLQGLLDSEAAKAQTAFTAVGAAIKSAGTKAGTAAAQAQGLAALVCPIMPGAACTALKDIAKNAGGAVSDLTGAQPDMVALGTSIGTIAAYSAALKTALDGMDKAFVGLMHGMDAFAIGLRSNKPTSPGLAEGLDQLTAGLKTYAAASAAGSASLQSAVAKLASGSSALAGGTDKAQQGASDLTEGASKVADGAGAAADGSTQLANGMGSLVGATRQMEGATRKVAQGAGQLQSRGTSKAVDGVIRASDQPALVEAWLKAASKRSTSAMPYGPPEGATGTAAFILTIEPVGAESRGVLDSVLAWLGLAD